MIELRGAWLSASLVMSLAALALPFECPPPCDCGERLHEREYECQLPAGGVFIKISLYESAKITCVDGVLRSSELPSIPFARNSTLPSLTLSGCPLDEPLADVLAVFAASAVGSLTLLDARGELRPEHLRGLDTITRLRMFDAGGQRGVPYSVLAALSSLQEYRLVGARVTLSADGFTNVSSALRFMELGNDSIEELPPGAFRGLERLPTLALWGNRIQNITADSFIGLDSLEKLDLSRNRVRRLAAGVFRRAAALAALGLHANRLEEVEAGAFGGLPRLDQITSLGNSAPLRLQPRSLADLTITTLKMTNCKITGLPADVFQNSTRLVTVQLTANDIPELPSGLFRDQAAVETLELANNKIRQLSADVFLGLRRLEKLVLDGNQIQVLPGQLFFGLQALTYVSICKNRLKHVATDAFHGVTSLRVLNLTDNELSFDEPGTAPDATNVASEPTTSEHEVTTASTNAPTNDAALAARATPGASPEDSMYADYEYEWYTPLWQYSPFASLLYLEELRLTNNRVSSVCYDWQYLLLHLKILDLARNNITEIQSVQFLAEDIAVDLSHNKISAVAVSAAPPGVPPAAHTQGTVLLDGNPLACDCHIYPFLLRIRGSLPMLTPEPKIQVGNARCARPSMLANKLVRDLPPSAVTCPSTCPSDCSCLLRPSTSHLEVNCSTLPSNFSQPPDATATELKLEVAPDSLFDLPATVTILQLDGIGLNEAPASAPSTLRELDLSRNELSRVPTALLEGNLSLRLAGNPFACDCSNDEFVLALRSSLVLGNIADGDSVRCADGQRPAAVDASRLCAVRQAALLGGLLAALGALVAAAAALAYRYSLEIKVFMYSREWLRWMVREDDVDRDKKYDAFISYSHKDERFVVENLVRQLESGPRPFRLCLHYRDWIVGEWIPAQIASSVEQSRRTVIVLSKHFLDSVWGSLEFRVAHVSAQRERRARVVVVLLEDVPPHDTLDPELRSYLTTNTYVKWGDPRFWEKLRYALAGCRIDQKTEKRARSLGEKIARSGLHGRLARGALGRQKDAEGAGDKGTPS